LPERDPHPLELSTWLGRTPLLFLLFVGTHFKADNKGQIRQAKCVGDIISGKTSLGKKSLWNCRSFLQSVISFIFKKKRQKYKCLFFLAIKKILSRVDFWL